MFTIESATSLPEPGSMARMGKVEMAIIVDGVVRFEAGHQSIVLSVRLW